MSPFSDELAALAHFSGGPPHIIGYGDGYGYGYGYGDGGGYGDGDGDGTSKELKI